MSGIDASLWASRNAAVLYVSHAFDGTHGIGTNGGEWGLRAQLATDIDRMPVEDASVRWPEEESPYVAAARIRVVAIDHRMTVSRGTECGRKRAYDMSAIFRCARNRCPIGEPDRVPDVED